MQAFFGIVSNPAANPVTDLGTDLEGIPVNAFSRRLLPISACLLLHVGHAASTDIGSRQSFCCVNIAQIARAILLAKVIATSLFGFRADKRASHEPSGID
nr:hypothetical protein [Qingshengfaniella alkalisoli]